MPGLARCSRGHGARLVRLSSIDTHVRTYLLTEIAEVQGGIQKRPKRRPAANACPFLRVANVTARGLDLDDVRLIELCLEMNLSACASNAATSWSLKEMAARPRSDALLFGMARSRDCVHQNHLIRVRPTDRLLPELLEAVSNSPRNREELTRVAAPPGDSTHPVCQSLHD
jgi:type I restriction enzyme S subunit